MKPARKRKLVYRAQEQYGASERRACGLIQIGRTTHRYQSIRDPQDELRLRLKELAAARPRYGSRRLHILLQREGWKINHKRVCRLYREEGLQVRRRRRRKVAARPRVRLPAPSELNHRWSLDFVADELVSGRRFRVLTVIDIHSRECLALKAGFSLTAQIVTAQLEEIIAERGVPVALTQDNGTEFTSRHYDAWAFSAGIQLDFYPAGTSGRELLHRELQRQATRRVLEPELVPEPLRGSGTAGRIPEGLQRNETAFFFRQPAACRVCPTAAGGCDQTPRLVPPSISVTRC